ncbi:hypothetical protein LJC26_06385 [Desulfovibrio sp. OttesenSCG-928-O18]|nr:hypothetical protein [Desulfovibrio sp. OttesenSCG-928-O18]
MGGHIDAIEIQAGTVISYLQTGKMRALGTTAYLDEEYKFLVQYKDVFKSRKKK